MNGRFYDYDSYYGGHRGKLPYMSRPQWINFFSDANSDKQFDEKSCSSCSSRRRGRYRACSKRVTWSLIGTSFVLLLLAVSSVPLILFLVEKDDYKYYKAEAVITLQGTYNSSLGNLSDPLSLEFQNGFCQLMEKTQEGKYIDTYTGCLVTGIRDGSIVVNFTMFYQAKETVSSDNVRSEITTFIETHSTEISSFQLFTTFNVTVNTTSLTVTTLIIEESSYKSETEDSRFSTSTLRSTTTISPTSQLTTKEVTTADSTTSDFLVTTIVHSTTNTTGPPSVTTGGQDTTITSPTITTTGDAKSSTVSDSQTSTTEATTLSTTTDSPQTTTATVSSTTTYTEKTSTASLQASTIEDTTTHSATTTEQQTSTTEETTLSTTTHSATTTEQQTSTTEDTTLSTTTHSATTTEQQTSTTEDTTLSTKTGIQSTTTTEQQTSTTEDTTLSTTTHSATTTEQQTSTTEDTTLSTTTHSATTTEQQTSTTEDTTLSTTTHSATTTEQQTSTTEDTTLSTTTGIQSTTTTEQQTTTSVPSTTTYTEETTTASSQATTTEPSEEISTTSEVTMQSNSTVESSEDGNDTISTAVSTTPTAKPIATAVVAIDTTYGEIGKMANQTCRVDVPSGEWSSVHLYLKRNDSWVEFALIRKNENGTIFNNDSLFTPTFAINGSHILAILTFNLTSFPSSQCSKRKYSFYCSTRLKSGDIFNASANFNIIEPLTQPTIVLHRTILMKNDSSNTTSVGIDATCNATRDASEDIRQTIAMEIRNETGVIYAFPDVQSYNVSTANCGEFVFLHWREVFEYRPDFNGSLLTCYRETVSGRITSENQTLIFKEEQMTSTSIPVTTHTPTPEMIAAAVVAMDPKYAEIGKLESQTCRVDIPSGEWISVHLYLKQNGSWEEIAMIRKNENGTIFTNNSLFTPTFAVNGSHIETIVRFNLTSFPPSMCSSRQYSFNCSAKLTDGNIFSALANFNIIEPLTQPTIVLHRTILMKNDSSNTTSVGIDATCNATRDASEDIRQTIAMEIRNDTGVIYTFLDVQSYNVSTANCGEFIFLHWSEPFEYRPDFNGSLLSCYRETVTGRITSENQTLIFIEQQMPSPPP